MLTDLILVHMETSDFQMTEENLRLGIGDHLQTGRHVGSIQPRYEQNTCPIENDFFRLFVNVKKFSGFRVEFCKLRSRAFIPLIDQLSNRVDAVAVLEVGVVVTYKKMRLESAVDKLFHKIFPGPIQNVEVDVFAPVEQISQVDDCSDPPLPKLREKYLIVESNESMMEQETIISYPKMGIGE